MLIASAGAHAQQQAATATLKPAESLLVPSYPGDTPWKQITNAKNNQGQLVEWIPSDQSPDDIKDILTEQVFLQLKSESPAMFLSGFLKRVGDACERARTNGPKEASENGYPIAYAQAYCTNQKGAGKDVDIFVKVIGGNDALYVVQREFRRPARPGATPGVTSFSSDQMGEMTSRLKAQSVANRFLADKVRLCPPSMDANQCAGSSLSAEKAPGPGSASPSVASSSPGPTSSSPFTEGKSTADEIKVALGKPSHEDHNPDGRFVYIYDASSGGMTAYLFDSKGVLIRIRRYAMTH